jgi:sigma-E factor negative regulatory protein RseC
MIEELAIVTRTAPGQVWIKRLQSGACGGCMQQSSCAGGTVAKILPKREFGVECDMALKAGDEVVVAIDDTHLLSTSLLLYVLPLLLMLLAVGLANQLLPVTLADIYLPVVALTSLLLAFWLVHRFQAVFLLHVCFKAQIVRRAAEQVIELDFGSGKKLES